MSILLNVIAIAISSIAIYYAGERFSDASSKLGKILGISESAKGATVDAISSSMPELSITLLSIIAYNTFKVGLGNVVGSALFNILLIPALCVFLAPISFKVSREVVHRDGLFYNLSIIILLTIVFFVEEWSLTVSLILIGAYLVYLLEFVRHGPGKFKERLTKFFKEGPSVIREIESEEKLFVRDILKLVGGLLIIIVASYFLVGHAIELSEALGIPAILISFTVVAAATSAPDMVISISNAKKGNISSASSNLFGSNIFDILIGLGFPVLIARLLGIGVEVGATSMGVIFGLLVSTVLVLYMFAENMELTKTKAVGVLAIYIVILIYVIQSTL